MGKLSDQELVEACLVWNATAQKELYDRFAPKMRAVCYRYIGDKDETKDVLQECFIKVFSLLKQYQGIGSLEGWIRKVVVNTSINYLKARKRLSMQPLDDSDQFNHYQTTDDSEGFSNAQFTQHQLLEALSRIPAEYKMVFTMYVIDSCSHKEIAEALGVKEETSRTRLLRAKQYIRLQLEKIVSAKSTPNIWP